MTNNGRDSNGRFAKGNPGGPGRPRRWIETDYLDILQYKCTPADFAEIVDKAIDQAKRGNPAARKWLSEWLLRGVPTLTELQIDDEAGRSAFDDAVQDRKGNKIDRLLRDLDV